jgi:hypothetical protein
MRHGKPIVYRVLADRMTEAGFVFYRSVNEVWLTKEVPVEYLKKEEHIFTRINALISEIKSSSSDDVEESLFSKNKWDDMQAALISILLDDQYTKAEYDKAAKILWDAILAGKEVQSDLIIGLLYYRLGNRNAPYDNNLIWSIAAELKKLDYANSSYNPFEDEAVSQKLDEYGIRLT